MNMLRATLDQWRAFHAVVDEGGFSQAAQALNRSQSAVSHAVARLQEQLGVRLLRIEGRRAMLTDIGREMLQRSRALVEDARAIESFADNLRLGWEAEIRLVVDAAYPADRLMRALQRFKPLSRGTRVRLSQVVMSGAVEALEAGEADLVITGLVPTGMLGTELLSFEFTAVAHPGHPLNRLQRPLILQDLEQELQLVIRDSGVRNPQDSGWLPAQNRWTVTSIDDALEAIRAGLGYCWLPQHKIDELIDRGELVTLNLREGRSYRVTMYMLYGDTESPGPATQLLADCLRDDEA